MEIINIDIEISNLLSKTQKIIDHIYSLCKDNKKYVLSDACSNNLNLYFGTVKRIEQLQKIKKCNHNYQCISKDDEIYYECNLCKSIL